MAQASSIIVLLARVCGLPTSWASSAELGVAEIRCQGAHMHGGAVCIDDASVSLQLQTHYQAYAQV